MDISDADSIVPGACKMQNVSDILQIPPLLPNHSAILVLLQVLKVIG